MAAVLIVAPLAARAVPGRSAKEGRRRECYCFCDGYQEVHRPEWRGSAV